MRSREPALSGGRVIMHVVERTDEKLLTRKVLAFLLVLVLLLCHGLYDGAHRYAVDLVSDVGPSPSSAHTVAEVPPDDRVGPDVGAGLLSHAATLLLFLAAAVMWLGLPRGWGPALAPPRPRDARTLALLRLSGASPPALLGVFRL